jgi:hypothetical protein
MSDDQEIRVSVSGAEVLRLRQELAVAKARVDAMTAHTRLLLALLREAGELLRALCEAAGPMPDDSPAKLFDRLLAEIDATRARFDADDQGGAA